MRTLAVGWWKKRGDLLRSAVLTGLVVALASCGGPQGGKPPTVDIKVNHTLTTVSENAKSPDDFKYIWAEGVTVPEAERERYTQYFFFSKSMDISGNDCTAKVTVQDPEGNDVGEVEWTLKLENEMWKLKSAPLP